MIFESLGLGTARYDAVNALGPPDAIIVVRTRHVEEKRVKALASELMAAYAALWQKMAVVRMQIYADQAAESCFLTILNHDCDTDKDFAQHALSVYRATLRVHKTDTPQPPITHDVCFLPHGTAVQYQGKD